MKTLLTCAFLISGAAFAQADAGEDFSKLPLRAAVPKVVAAHQPQIAACYEETLAATKSKILEGKLMAHWVITPEGIVKGAKIQKKGTTLKDPKLHECVVAVILSMEFPKPPLGKEQPIDYPFNLKADK